LRVTKSITIGINSTQEYLLGWSQSRTKWAHKFFTPNPLCLFARVACPLYV